MFFLAEFISTLFMSALFATIYMGGYRFFGLENLTVTIAGSEWVIGNLIGLMVFFAKTFTVYFLFIWIRGTLPRVRIDQMLNLNWKFLVPLSLVLLLVVALVEKLIPAGTDPYYRAGIHLLTNLLVGFVTLEILRRLARRRRVEAGEMPADNVTGRGPEEEAHDRHVDVVPATH